MKLNLTKMFMVSLILTGVIVAQADDFNDNAIRLLKSARYDFCIDRIKIPKLLKFTEQNQQDLDIICRGVYIESSADVIDAGVRLGWALINSQGNYVVPENQKEIKKLGKILHYLDGYSTFIKNTKLVRQIFGEPFYRLEDNERSHSSNDSLFGDQQQGAVQ